MRGTQATTAFAERRGWSSLARLPADQAFLKLLDQNGIFPGLTTAEDLLAHFRTRKEPDFFAGFAHREATIAALRSRWPNLEKQIVEKADRILAGKFDLLGLRDLSFGTPIDWQLEPVSAKRAPSVHWSRVNYLDAAVTGDKKIVWELNRHQYFATLGQAYWLTGDERYAQTFVAHLSSWMDQNPPKLGINWASSLEVAFRSISWLWACYFFKDSPALTSAKCFCERLSFFICTRGISRLISQPTSVPTHI